MGAEDSATDTNSNGKLMRRFSRAFSVAGEHIEGALEDVSSFLDVSENVEAVLEEDRKAVEEASMTPAANETPLQKTERQEMAQKLSQGVMDPKKIMMHDKIVFFIGVVNVALIGYWVGRSPSTYYHYWTFKCLTLFPLRYFAYRQKGWHYLMLELCYAGNLLGMVHVYWYPHSVFMRKLAFAYGAGPLMWSIIAMRNSLVFHSFDKMTTLMMHASPAITVWALRWHPDPAQAASMSPEQAAGMQRASWHEMIVLPTIFYCLWVVLYYTITFVLLKNRIEGRGRLTMFSMMVPKDREKAQRSLLARTVLSAPQSLQVPMYLACHAVAAIFALLPTALFYNHYSLHTAALMFCLGLAIWNGGNFYFKVFAKHYLKQLEEAAAASAAGVDGKKNS